MVCRSDFSNLFSHSRTGSLPPADRWKIAESFWLETTDLVYLIKYFSKTFYQLAAEKFDDLMHGANNDLVTQAVGHTPNVKTIHPHPTLGDSIGMAVAVAHGSCTDLPPARR